jgi:hypothetical protein
MKEMVYNQSKSLHRREILNEVHLLERTRIKLAHRVADLSFLKRCKDSKVIPGFAVIKHHLHKEETAICFYQRV